MIEFREVLSRLIEHEVEFIVIGGVAATVHGPARVAYDLAIVYRHTRDNIAQLVAAHSHHSTRICAGRSRICHSALTSKRYGKA